MVDSFHGDERSQDYVGRTSYFYRQNEAAVARLDIVRKGT
jgi:hypothetical protein